MILLSTVSGFLEEMVKLLTETLIGLDHSMWMMEQIGLAQAWIMPDMIGTKWMIDLVGLPYI